jgi:hypothetical protein
MRVYHIVVEWIGDFLTGRSHMIRVGNELSGKRDVTSGVPQGSVLGPILFLIFINYIAESVSSDIYVFADDTKLCRTIDDDMDTLSLQGDWTNY